MKKLIICLVTVVCLAVSSAFAAAPTITQMEKMTSTQLRMAILQVYSDQGTFMNVIKDVAENGTVRLQNRFCLALQQVFTSKAALSAADREKVADYALAVMKGSGFAYVAADGSYRVQMGKSTPTYEDDDDYKRVSEPAKTEL